ncbi:MAG: Flp pilus assembly complex ATPase component TadA [Ruminococcus flavefaciens]|nr:Flp pilus assembly complex ATPase component TadA [Ruminococcus flavefaciens]
MTDSTSYETILSYMIPNVRNAMQRVPENERKATEIRLRSGRAISYIFSDRIKYLTYNGQLTENYLNSENISVTADEIKQTVEKLCHFSVHSCTKELHEGYFVLRGGIRVGLAGTYSDTAGKTISSFNALNFRIARCIVGCAEKIYERISGKSVLICGGVNTGKTTILRDLCRMCGNSFKVSLIDERNEISSVSGGLPENDVGVLTDVLVGCSRAEGIISAVRTLSPDMIFCDEISTYEDAEAILKAFGCGVKFSATVHAENYENLLKRPAIKPLLESGVFEYAVFLENMGRIKEIRRLGRCFSG